MEPGLRAGFARIADAPPIRMNALSDSLSLRCARALCVERTFQLSRDSAVSKAQQPVPPARRALKSSPAYLVCL